MLYSIKVFLGLLSRQVGLRYRADMCYAASKEIVGCGRIVRVVGMALAGRKLFLGWVVLVSFMVVTSWRAF